MPVTASRSFAAVRNVLTRLRRVSRRDAIIPHFARSVAVLATRSITGQVLVFLSVPVLSRMYSPEEFGALSVFSSVLGVIAIIATLRFENAILVPAKDDEANQVLLLSICVATATAIATAIAVAAAGKAFSEAIGSPNLYSDLWILPFAVWAAGVYSSFINRIIRARDYTIVGRLTLRKVVVQVVTQVGLGLVGLGPSGLILGKTLERSTGIITLYRRMSGEIRRALADISPKALWRTASAYRAFPLYSTGASLMRALSVQIPPLLLAKFYGIDVAGMFAITNRVLGTPLQTVGNAVGHVYLGHAAHLMHRDPVALRKLFTNTAIRLAAIGALPALALTLWGEKLLSWFLGEDWSLAGSFVRVLAVMYMAQFVVSPLVMTVEIMRRQGVRFVWEIIQTSAAVGALTAARVLDWGPVSALALYSGTMVIGYVGFYEVNRRIVNRPAGEYSWTN